MYWIILKWIVMYWNVFERPARPKLQIFQQGNDDVGRYIVRSLSQTKVSILSLEKYHIIEDHINCQGHICIILSLYCSILIRSCNVGEKLYQFQTHCGLFDIQSGLQVQWHCYWAFMSWWLEPKPLISDISLTCWYLQFSKRSHFCILPLHARKDSLRD